MTLIQYIRSGKDPQNNVVMLEDTVAVGGCVVAAACMALTRGQIIFENFSWSPNFWNISYSRKS